MKVKGGPITHMLDYSPTKTQELLGNPDKPANPTASSPACAGLSGEHCIYIFYVEYTNLGEFAVAR